MRIIARRTLSRFWQTHSAAKAPLEAWYKETETAYWETPDDIKKRYPSASFLRIIESALIFQETISD